MLIKVMCRMLQGLARGCWVIADGKAACSAVSALPPPVLPPPPLLPPALEVGRTRERSALEEPAAAAAADQPEP